MTNVKTSEDRDSSPSPQEMSLKDLREQINHLEDGVILLISLNDQEDAVWI